MTGDDATEKTYWTRQMEDADAFMRRVCEYPVEECGEPLVSLSEAVEQAGVEAVFSQSPALEGVPRIFRLRAGLIEPFVAACRDLNQQGWVMKVEDGFRTSAMQKALAHKPAVFDAILRAVLRETGGKAPKAEFLARRAAVLVAANPKSGTHTSGSAIDLSVLDREGGGPIDRGAPYLEISALTPLDSPFVSDEARRKRRRITDLMRRHDFTAYPYEFWHYCAGDALAECFDRTGRPARYGPVDWDPATGRVTPIADPLRPLSSPEEIAQSFRESLRRLSGR